MSGGEGVNIKIMRKVGEVIIAWWFPIFHKKLLLSENIHRLAYTIAPLSYDIKLIF